VVHILRQTSPYIDSHVDQTFVLVIPGSLSTSEGTLGKLMQDVALLNFLRVRVVLVIGGSYLFNQVLAERGLETQHFRGHRVTDDAALEVAQEIAGRMRIQVESLLSRTLPVSALRRHGYNQGFAGDRYHVPTVQCASGNYIFAKHRGIVEGIDFANTGEVRGVWTEAIIDQLDRGALVLLGNIGYSPAGETLNCSVFDVAVKAAEGLQADKLIFYKTDYQGAGLKNWVPLPEAEHLVQQAGGMVDSDFIRRIDDVPIELTASVVACQSGVTRSHIIDPYIDGALLLELFTRDGSGTMVSTDIYEGMRRARPSDVGAIFNLMQPLQDEGTLVARTREEIAEAIEDYLVVDRDGILLAVGILSRITDTTAEISGFMVRPKYRGVGRGDSLLDYLEQVGREQGYEEIVLLTTRTADWFVARGFEHCGPAHDAPELPEPRRAKVDPARNSQLYLKQLETTPVGPAGSRIGF